MMIGLNQDWKNAANLDDIKSLVDRGILVNWKDGLSLRKKFELSEKSEVVEYLVQKFFERYTTRLSAEIVVETLITWIATMRDEALVGTMLETFLGHPECEKSIYNLVEIILAADYSEHSHDKEMFSLGVSLVCELGIGFNEVNHSYPDLYKKTSLSIRSYRNVPALRVERLRGQHPPKPA